MKNPWDVLRGRELPVVVFWCYCVLGMALAITCAFNARRRAWGYVARTYADVMLAIIAVALIRTPLFIVDPEVEVRMIEQ